MIEIEYVHTVSEMEQNSDSQLSSTFESDIILAGIQVSISSWRLCFTGNYYRLPNLDGRLSTWFTSRVLIKLYTHGGMHRVRSAQAQRKGDCN
jgi:hypothetical protein